MPRKLPQGGIVPPGQLTGGNEGGPELVAPLAPTPGCQNAENCPAQGRGHWLHHTDKSGQRTTVHEADGTFWNRACPVAGCTLRVFG